jgi:hypothetical protein
MKVYNFGYASASGKSSKVISWKTSEVQVYQTPENNRIQYEYITSPKVIEDYGFV